MALSEADELLQQASVSDKGLPLLLSQVLRIFLHERMQPVDPAVVSEQACRQLLAEHPGLPPLLEEAIIAGKCDGLWHCDILQFHDVDLVSFHSASDDDDRIRQQAATTLAEYKGIIADFANGRSRLASWAPVDSAPEPNEEYLAFISELEIPRAHDSPPCLLLHDLGRPYHEDDASHRAHALFRPDCHTIFINASGTGKTRMLLEGLCRYWGVYLPCALDASRIGSKDLSLNLAHDIRADKYFRDYPPFNYGTLLTNESVAQRAFTASLLARLLFLATFLESVRAEERDKPETRKRWVHIHNLPSGVECADITSTLTRQIKDATPKFLKHAVADALLKVRALLGRRDLPIFCAADDCQVVDTKLHVMFRDGISPVRLMAGSWDIFEGVTVIITGTSLDQTPFPRSGSTRYRLYTDTGSFDSREVQRAYILRYLPPSFAKSASGRLLLDRMWIWLKGRYRFTTPFLSCLLTTCYRQPHSLLNGYIAAQMLMVADDVPPAFLEGNLSHADAALVQRFYRFSGESMEYDVQSWLSAQAIMYRICLGDESVPIYKNCFSLVQHGIAPFADDQGTEVRAFEPLTLFPLSRVMFPVIPGLVDNDGILSTDRTSDLHEPPCQAQHMFFAVVLLHVLKERRPLCDVFTFPGIAPAWAQQKADLVRVKGRPGARPRVTAVRASFATARPRERWITSSLDWMKQKSDAPFCDASRFSEADLLFVLRLENGQCLYVALATIFSNAHVEVSTAAIEQRFNAIAPDTLLRQPPGVEDKDMLCLRKLPVEVPGIGNPPLLRVVATHPNELDVAIVDRDAHGPIASVNMILFREVAATITEGHIFRRITDVLVRRRGEKRKRSSDADAHETKRPRTRAMAREERASASAAKTPRRSSRLPSGRS
ncbi:hypothetical protein HDZ31DRAFT_41959 [Schizophyllum fasciatum]